MALVRENFRDVSYSINATGFFKGQSTAFKWYSAGCRTLEDLRNRKGGVCLSSVQMIGLEYYNGIDT
jgi:DNA polymerase lambda